MNMEIFNRKIVIVGAGRVGAQTGYALVAQGLAESLVFIDPDRRKAEAQALDLADAVPYLPTRTKIRAGDYADARDAQLMLIAAGALPDPSKGQTRMDMLRPAVQIMDTVAAGIRASGFRGIIVNLSNPADVVTQYLQFTLDWPPHRILSTGTAVDSARLRRALSDVLDVDAKSIDACVLGEHGESQMIPWSAVTVGEQPLRHWLRAHPHHAPELSAIAQAVRTGGWDILRGKGATEFGIATTAAAVIRAIFRDENRILPVSVRLDGAYGQSGVYAGVPAVLNRTGVAGVVALNLDDAEQSQFAASCAAIRTGFAEARRIPRRA